MIHTDMSDSGALVAAEREELGGKDQSSPAGFKVQRYLSDDRQKEFPGA